MRKSLFFLIFLFLLCRSQSQQIANYVNNGGFENKYNCNPTNSLDKAKYWSSIDSLSFAAFIFDYCYSNVPFDGLRYQFPRSGNTFVGTTFYFSAVYNSRGYLRNRLKSNLQVGEVYCVKFYVNIGNVTNYSIDAFGAYFGNGSIDTITKCTIPLSYITPQVKTPNNYFITDTLNWVAVTGTFVAMGTEKYLVIGNFKPNGGLDSLLINSTYLGNTFTDAYIDDVSCIDLNLPAYAGPDLWCIPGDSVFIGRQPDVGIDEDCMWYKLPNTNTAIDTVAGLWVKPNTTTSYLVRQEICGIVKWDLVTVYESATGLQELELQNQNLKVYPQPAIDELNLSFEIKEPKDFKVIEIYNNLGQKIREEKIEFVDRKAIIKTDDLPNGVYILKLQKSLLDSARSDNLIVNKRFVIAR